MPEAAATFPCIVEHFYLDSLVLVMVSLGANFLRRDSSGRNTLGHVSSCAG